MKLLTFVHYTFATLTIASKVARTLWLVTVLAFLAIKFVVQFAAQQWDKHNCTHKLTTLAIDSAIDAVEWAVNKGAPYSVTYFNQIRKDYCEYISAIVLMLHTATMITLVSIDQSCKLTTQAIRVIV
jgi:hypothetical protein